MRVSKLLLCACFMTTTGIHTATGQAPAERVAGIGGFFFRAKDPKALAEWYERHLGVTQTPQSYEVEPWKQEAGNTVFAPFRRTRSTSANRPSSG